jgi:23S rRNA (cytosine1962-C5)-methyltransferase
MERYPRVILKHGKEASLKRFHPWLFSGAIERTIGSCHPGDIVEIYSMSHDYLATGHFQDGSIAVKLFSFQQQEIDSSFWKTKIEKAYRLRTTLGLTTSSSTTAYRLVFTEGDELPGLIIDWYNGVAVIQTHSLGMHLIKPELVTILQEIYGDELKAVYDKSAETTLGSFSLSPEDIKEGKLNRVENGYLWGIQQPGLITETGHNFAVDWERGQKTGFFLDQRSNRMFAQFYAKDKKVLNAFCYSGAFSVYALKGGATRGSFC